MNGFVGDTEDCRDRGAADVDIHYTGLVEPSIMNYVAGAQPGPN